MLQVAGLSQGFWDLSLRVFFLSLGYVVVVEAVGTVGNSESEQRERGVFQARWEEGKIPFECRRHVSCCIGFFHGFHPSVSFHGLVFPFL